MTDQPSSFAPGRPLRALWQRREGLSFLGLLLFVAWATLRMVYNGDFIEGTGPGVTALPSPEDTSFNMQFLLLYSVMFTMGIPALFTRRLRYFPMLIATLAVAPTIYYYSAVVPTTGFSTPFVQVEEIGRIILAGLTGYLLIAPWLLRSIPWPYRSPGHLAIGIAIMAGFVLQFVFHFAIVVPHARIAEMAFLETEEMILATRDNDELARLIALGALPLVELDAHDEARLLEQFREGDLSDLSYDTLAASVGSIMRSGRETVYTWHVPGRNAIDRHLLAYDGRALASGGQAHAYHLPGRAFHRERRQSASSYLYLTGMSGFVWLSGALLVGWGHDRHHRRRDRARRASDAKA